MNNLYLFLIKSKLLARGKRLILASIVIVFYLSLIISPNAFTEVHAASDWYQPDKVLGYENDTEPPYMIADKNRTIHAFASQLVGEDNPQLAIVYSRWNATNGWSLPVDIILSPIKEARIMGAFLDNSGMMNVIFFGGEEPSGSIYYSQAPGVDAAQTSAWSTPALIGNNALIPNSAALIGDGNKKLVVIYSGNLNGFPGVFSIVSNDGGNTWTDPTPVFLTKDPGLQPYGLQLSLGKTGILHAVWYVVNYKGNNVSAYYANFDMNSDQWHGLIQLAEGFGIDVGMGISNMSVIEYDQKVFVVYNNGIPPNGVPPAEWMIVSRDYGSTWSDPIRPFPQHVGRNGVISLLIDGENNLQMFFADRIPFFINGVYSQTFGIYQSTWLGDHWSGAEEVFGSGQHAQSIDRSVGAYDVRAISSQGNVIMVTWRFDPGGIHNGVWYTYKSLDFPEQPAEELPVPASQTNPGILTTKPAAITTPLATAGSINPAELNENPSSKINPGSYLLVGLIPVMILILLALFIHFRRQVKIH